MTYRRVIFVFGLCLLSFLFTLFVYINRISDESLKGKDVENYRKVIGMGNIRGRFLDADGKFLTDLEVNYNVIQLNSRTGEHLKERVLMEKILGKKLEFKEYKFLGYSEIRGISQEDVYKLMRNKYRLKTVIFVPSVKRKLVCKECFHIIGSVSSDGIGLGGLERLYDKSLRGKFGNIIIESDALGNVVSTPYMDINLLPRDVKLTLRYDLFLLADSLFKNYDRGAVFMFNPKNGYVYLSYSKPSPIDTTDPSYAPLLNRALSGLYPPGSTFKPLIALLSLKYGVIDTGFGVSCKGAISVGNRVFKCWSVHGYVKIERAISHSCNVFFYNVGGRFGAGRILNALKETGLFNRRFTNLLEEVPSRIPVKAIYLGTALNIAIGQGEVLVTPVFMAVEAGLIGNGGWVVLPRFSNFERQETLKVMAPEWAYDIVKRGMLKVVEEGTAYYSRIQGFQFGGKTGTAQNPHGEDHSLFIAFAPYDDPEVAIAVVVENAGHGSSAAAPIASALIRHFFNLKITRDEKVYITSYPLNSELW
ncbi:MAG: penicillin-binding transpeptidase domain-containing protein [candidate division WOR-3 bacterium]